MINVFIFAAIAFLFWGKMTKEEEEKIQNASWIKTSIYLALSFLVGVFYIKTYQVATIKNIIQVNGHLCSHNKQTGGIADTIEIIDIMNRYTDSRYFSKLAQFSPQGSDPVIEDIDNKGGLVFVHTLRYDSLCTIQQHNNDINNDVEGIGHNYTITYIATKIPSISLVQNKFSEDADSSGNINKEHYLLKSKTLDLSNVGNLDEDPILKFVGSFGLINSWCETTFDLDSIRTFQKSLRQTINSKDLNTFNFFTAADISQCSYILGINSDCPIRNFRVSFDIPVELSPIPYKVNQVSAYGFAITEPEATKEIQQSFIDMHVKFPTLANMQLIRSLILTTILSALISLFLSNLYFLICRLIRYVKREAKLEYEPSKLEIRRKVYRNLAIVICVLIGLGGFLILFDKYIWIEYKFIRYAVLVVNLFIIAVASCILLFEYSLIKKKPSKK